MFSDRRINAKFNWFNFRRKLTNAKSKKIGYMAYGRYANRVVPHIKANIKRVRVNYRRFYQNYQPSRLKYYKKPK